MFKIVETYSVITYNKASVKNKLSQINLFCVLRFFLNLETPMYNNNNNNNNNNNINVCMRLKKAVNRKKVSRIAAEIPSNRHLTERSYNNLNNQK